MTSERYNARDAEPRWQRQWDEQAIFVSRNDDSRPKYYVVPKPGPRVGDARTEPDDVQASIDPILDKISKFGIGSLTASERRQLNRERERLLKNSQ